MSNQVLRAKTGTPDALRFSGINQIAFQPITLSASEVSSAVAARLPLSVGCKIIGATIVLSGSPAGTCSLNIVSGPYAYEGTSSASGQIEVFGSAGAGGTDTLTATINGTPCTTAAIPAGTQAPLAALLLAAAVNANGTVNATVVAVAAGSINGGAAVTIVALTPGAAGNTITIAASGNNALGQYPTFLNAKALSGTLSGGAASGAVPVVATTDSTNIGIAPPNTALTNQALFATDQIVTMTADLVQSFYPTADEFDAIFPKNSELTLRIVTNGAGAGTLQVVLLVQSVDEYITKPQVGAFAPTLSSF